jgi:hypothetical protein
MDWKMSKDQLYAVVEPVNCENPTHENRFPVIVGEGLIAKVLLVVVVPHSYFN